MRNAGRIMLIGQLGLLLLCHSIVLGAVGVKGNSGREGQLATQQSCRKCHPQRYVTLMNSVHRHGAAAEAEGGVFCEKCHGDGSSHVMEGGGRGVAIFAFDDAADPQEKAAYCLTCHYRSPDLALWDMGVHSRNGVSCDDCHVMHPDNRQKTREQERCFACHRRVKVEANKRSHHPILEGKLDCSSCHQPHGTMNRGLVRATSSQMLCYSCHAEKRGPAVWTHPPVEENCQTCHKPHGSTHASLLVERVPQLCRNCHDWSRTPGSPYSEAAGRSSGKCAQNHPAVHGSSAPSGGGSRLSR